MANYLVYTGSENRGNWATYVYVDNMNSSINQQFINLKYYTDSSFLARDLSINALFNSIGIGYESLKNYTDASLLQRDASLNFVYNNFENYVRSSSINGFQFVKEASLGPKFYWKTNGTLDISGGTNGSLFDLSDVSIAPIVMGSRDGRVLQYDESDFVWRDVPDTSIYYFAKFIQSASINDTLTWKNGKLSTTFDTSIVDPLVNQVVQYDASDALWRNKSTIDADTYYYTKEYIDAHFYTKEQIDALLAAIVGGSF